MYGQVKKSYQRRKQVRVSHVMRLGTPGRSQSHLTENELANFWRNETSRVVQRWQREEPTDGGQHGKYSVIPYRRCHSSHIESE